MVSGAFNGSSVYRAYHGLSGRRNEFGASSPAGAEEQRPLELGNREVEDQELVQVVAAIARSMKFCGYGKNGA